MGQAEYWETALGDNGRRYENFVLDMSSEQLTFEQQRRAVDILFSWHDWY